MTARVNTYLDGIKSLEISQPFKCLIMLSLRTIADFCYVSLVIMLASFLPSFSSLADPDLHESSFVVLLGVGGRWGGGGESFTVLLKMLFGKLIIFCFSLRWYIERHFSVCRLFDWYCFYLLMIVDIIKEVLP